ncbi:MAG: hypothetical protein ACI4WT_09455 [Oligosphaeraceae bacterium]
MKRGTLAGLVVLGMLLRCVAADGGEGLALTWPSGAPVPEVVSKASPERRLVAARSWSLPAGECREWRSLSLEVRLLGGAGLECRPAVYLEEEGGAVWVRVGQPLRAGSPEPQRVLLSLGRRALRPLAYTPDGGGELDWGRVSRVRVGVLADGAGQAEVRYGAVRLLDESWRPEGPQALELAWAKDWRVSSDRAVRDVRVEDVTLPEGGRAVRIAFTFPTGHHMYLLPTMPLPECDFATYSGIRLTYRATPPRPLGLLVLLNGEGGQYGGGPTPSASDEWRSVELRFADFRGVGWAKAIAGKPLPLDSIASIVIGCHGSADAKGDGRGEILVRSLELIP